MNGLIKPTNLDAVNILGSLAIAISSCAVVIYMIASGGAA